MRLNEGIKYPFDFFAFLTERDALKIFNFIVFLRSERLYCILKLSKIALYVNVGHAIIYVAG